MTMYGSIMNITAIGETFREIHDKAIIYNDFALSSPNILGFNWQDRSEERRAN